MDAVMPREDESRSSTGGRPPGRPAHRRILIGCIAAFATHEVARMGLSRRSSPEELAASRARIFFSTDT